MASDLDDLGDVLGWHENDRLVELINATDAGDELSDVVEREVVA